MAQDSLVFRTCFADLQWDGAVAGPRPLPMGGVAVKGHQTRAFTQSFYRPLMHVHGIGSQPGMFIWRSWIIVEPIRLDALGQKIDGLLRELDKVTGLIG